MFSLRRRETLQRANITHVLSVLSLPLDKMLFAPYKHMVVKVDDVEDENLLEHFTTTNGFIQEGLEGGGGVLVHCAMGKSRSAACVMAYLIQKYHVTPQEALERLQQSRPICEPNPGFMQQLELYHQLQAPTDLDSHPAYQRWVYKREVELSIACGKVPDKIRFEDEQLHAGPSSGSAAAGIELRCRKCRQAAAAAPNGQVAGDHTDAPAPCSHFFLDPLSWMKAELELGKLDGKFECPKCGATVGKYAWQGLRCSCSEWIVPAISLARGKVDEVRSLVAAPGPVQRLKADASSSSSSSSSSPPSPPPADVVVESHRQQRVPREENL
ncbi:hypothetical protein GP486_008490 [Trichoglossum hirsutum]|uniref:protein-tyrosine-phosphatase n=1 Tax=Trichoglossum hirsutum TaxID=265104 RepID=A0A9P8IE97_9PEZI|nr:hypothetical protein GP486_008490 [Trichoglossum hirsutum]